MSLTFLQTSVQELQEGVGFAALRRVELAQREEVLLELFQLDRVYDSCHAVVVLAAGHSQSIANVYLRLFPHNKRNYFLAGLVQLEDEVSVKKLLL